MLTVRNLQGAERSCCSNSTGGAKADRTWRSQMERPAVRFSSRRAAQTKDLASLTDLPGPYLLYSRTEKLTPG